MRKHLFLLFLFVSPLLYAQEDMFVYLTTSTIQSTQKGGSDADYSIMRNTQTQAYRIEIISEIFGVVRSYTTTERNAQISMSGLLPGVYFIRLSSDNDILSTSLLLVQ